MSRHDKTIARAKLAVSPPDMQRAIRDLITALYEEIAAHDQTRESRNTASKAQRSLIGTVRGLEAKVQRLQEEAAERSEDEALGFHRGVEATKKRLQEFIDDVPIHP